MKQEPIFQKYQIDAGNLMRGLVSCTGAQVLHRASWRTQDLEGSLRSRASAWRSCGRPCYCWRSLAPWLQWCVFLEDVKGCKEHPLQAVAGVPARLFLQYRAWSLPAFLFACHVDDRMTINQSVRVWVGCAAVLWAGGHRDQKQGHGDRGEAGAAAGHPQESPYPLDRLPQLLRPGQHSACPVSIYHAVVHSSPDSTSDILSPGRCPSLSYEGCIQIDSDSEQRGTVHAQEAS